jgi:hypothetical protein
MQEIAIERRLGEVIVVKYAGCLTTEQAARIRRHVEHSITTGCPLVLDRGFEIEVICTPASMHADYSARFGDTA